MARAISENIQNSIDRGAKHCPGCFEYKDHSNYTPDKTKTDKVEHKCKPCTAKAKYQYVLKKRLANGCDVLNCSTCDFLFVPTKFARDKCQHCREKYVSTTYQYTLKKKQEKPRFKNVIKNCNKCGLLFSIVPGRREYCRNCR